MVRSQKSYPWAENIAILIKLEIYTEVMDEEAFSVQKSSSERTLTHNSLSFSLSRYLCGPRSWCLQSFNLREKRRVRLDDPKISKLGSISVVLLILINLRIHKTELPGKVLCAWREQAASTQSEQTTVYWEVRVGGGSPHIPPLR